MSVSQLAEERAMDSIDKITGLIAVDPDIDGSTIAQKLDLPIETVFKHVSTLVEKGVIKGYGVPTCYSLVRSTSSKKVPVKEGVLTDRIVELLKRVDRPLDTDEIARTLGVVRGSALNSCGSLFREGRIERIGTKPYHYLISNPGKKAPFEPVSPTSSKVRSKTEKTHTQIVHEFIEGSKDPLTRTEIAKSTHLRDSQVSPILTHLKKKGIIEAVNKKAPFKFVLCNTETKSVVEKKTVPEKKPAKVKSQKAEKFGDYVILFFTEGSSQPEIVHKFRDKDHFIQVFESLQQRSSIKELSAFKKVGLTKRVIYTPAID